MPKLKKEAETKKAVKKTRIRKNKKEESLSKAKPITIDVIADDEDVLTKYPVEKLSLEDQDREKLDVQKKFFSDLVSEIKDKNQISNLSTSLENDQDEGNIKKKSLYLYRRIAFQFITLTVLFLIIIAYFFLPSLTISLHPSAEVIADSISFNVVSNLDKNKTSETNGRILTGKIQSIPLSAEKVYEASGEEVLGEEIVGEVTLHNEYSKPQPLVANTRLLSPDNKLFRLKEAVNIPAGGKVKAEIYADKISQEMAISPTRFTIPGLWLGLQDKIYATSDKAFEYKHRVKKYIKQRDIDQAINDIKSVLAAKVDKSITTFYNNNEAIAYTLDDSNAQINLKAKLGEEVNEFTVSATNTLTLVSFSKEEAEKLVKAKLTFLLPDDKKLANFDSKDIVYRLDNFDFDKGTATITASFKGIMSLRTDANIIDRRKLVNLNQEQIKNYLDSFPEIESYELKFFPTFIKRAPSLADRIKVTVD